MVGKVRNFFSWKVATAVQTHFHLCKISCWIHQILHLFSANINSRAFEMKSWVPGVTDPFPCWRSPCMPRNFFSLSFFSRWQICIMTLISEQKCSGCFILCANRVCFRSLMKPITGWPLLDRTRERQGSSWLKNTKFYSSLSWDVCVRQIFIVAVILQGAPIKYSDLYQTCSPVLSWSSRIVEGHECWK